MFFSLSLLALGLRARRGLTDLAGRIVAGAHNAVVNRTADAVAHLHVDLREEGAGSIVHHRGIGDIARGGGLDHVAHDEALDGFVLRDHATAVGAVNRLGVAATLLRAAVVAALDGHLFFLWEPFSGAKNVEYYVFLTSNLRAVIFHTRNSVQRLFT